MRESKSDNELDESFLISNLFVPVQLTPAQIKEAKDSYGATNPRRRRKPKKHISLNDWS